MASNTQEPEPLRFLPVNGITVRADFHGDELSSDCGGAQPLSAGLLRQLCFSAVQVVRIQVDGLCRLRDWVTLPGHLGHGILLDASFLNCGVNFRRFLSVIIFSLPSSFTFVGSLTTLTS